MESMKKIKTETLVEYVDPLNILKIILQTTNLDERTYVELDVTVDEITRFEEFGMIRDDIASCCLNSLIDQMIVNMFGNQQDVMTSSDFLMYKIKNFDMHDIINCKEKIKEKIDEILSHT